MRISERRLKLYLSGFVYITEEEKSFLLFVETTFIKFMLNKNITFLDNIELKSEDDFGVKLMEELVIICTDFIYIKNSNFSNYENILMISKEIVIEFFDFFKNIDMDMYDFYVYTINKYFKKEISTIYLIPSL